MYVRVTPLSFDPAKTQEIKRFTDERILPLIRPLQGFRRYTSAFDQTTGRGVAISEWDDQQHAEGFRTAVSSILPGIADLGVTLETSQVYEVLVQT